MILQKAWDTRGMTVHMDNVVNNPSNYLVEPKIDGIRAAAMILNGSVKFISIRGKPLYNLNLISDELVANTRLDGYMLDGELYAGDWNKTISITRSSKTVKNAFSLIYYVFDILPINEVNKQACSLTLIQRKKRLDALLNDTEHIKKVSFKKLTSIEELQTLYNIALKNGFEGVMLKEINSVYSYNRSSSWLKVKEIQSDEFLCIDVIEGTGRNKGRLGAIVIQTGETTCNVGGGFSDEQRVYYWNNKHKIINQIVEIAYQSKTINGKLRSPRFLRVRVDL